MKRGIDIVSNAKQHIGEKYVFGALVPKNKSDWKGPWDCAEFASWLVYQSIENLYGCLNDKGDPAGADSYTGYWGRDAKALGRIVSIEEASKTPGAFMLRLAANGSTGHIVVCDGTGGTIEAYSTSYGVITNKLDHRRWDFGVLVPGINYDVVDSTPTPLPPAEKIYRYTSPMMHDDNVRNIQQALKAKGFSPGSIDGWYGPMTMNAAKLFQADNGLVADGEVGPLTSKLLTI